MSALIAFLVTMAFLSLMGYALLPYGTKEEASTRKVVGIVAILATVVILILTLIIS